MSNTEELAKKLTSVFQELATMAILAKAAKDLAEIGRKDLGTKVMQIGDEEFLGEGNGRKSSPTE